MLYGEVSGVNIVHDARVQEEQLVGGSMNLQSGISLHSAAFVLS
jgi:hypothetical protein